MTIRLMTIQDYDRVFALWKATPGVGLNHMDDSREGIERYLSRNPTTCFVAEDDGGLAGAIMSGHDGRRGFIHHTVVSPSCRRAGLGRRLVACVVEALQREGINKAALVVFRDNQLGNAFWESQGFSRRDDLIYRNRVLGAPLDD